MGVPEIGFRVRALYFRRALRQLPSNPTRLLDAGSGLGAYAIFLARRYPSAAVVGCDLDESKTAFCNQLRDELHATNLRFVTADLARLEGLGDPFDAIVCIDVLEHIVDYMAALRGFYRMLKPGGSLYLHVPRTKQERILSRFRDWHHEGHVREGFSPDSLAFALREVGFEVKQSRQTFGLPGKLAWELNHVTLVWSLTLAGLAFPLLWLVASLDMAIETSDGLGLMVVARKTL